ncbi:hypothetical protein LSAT2_029700 [Lamellibrachia satsuma]|nr:hypothetical protein LSAT2_029700 [Lamellibrachia satsuma]
MCGVVFQCGVVLPKNAEFPGLLVVSSTRLYVLRIAGKQSTEHPDKWLKTVQQQTLTSLRHIEQGLGSQLFHLDFGAVCLTALLRDEAHCQSFTRQLTDVLQEWVFRGTRTPPEVTRVNPSELADLTQNVLLHQDRAGVMDVDDVDTTLLKFVMCHQETTLTGESCLVPVDLIVTPSHMYLATDDTVCRPAVSVDASSKKSSTQKAQFAFKARHKLLDLTSIDLYKADPTKAALHFVDECSQEETVWRIVMETKPSLLSLVSSISQPWEREFGVDLQVNVCVE